jgi:hypothetical protein
VTAALFDMHLYIYYYLQVEDLARLSFKNKPVMWASTTAAPQPCMTAAAAA